MKFNFFSYARDSVCVEIVKCSFGWLPRAGNFCLQVNNFYRLYQVHKLNQQINFGQNLSKRIISVQKCYCSGQNSTSDFSISSVEASSFVFEIMKTDIVMIDKRNSDAYTICYNSILHIRIDDQ